MNKSLPFTIPNLVKAMKKAGFATKNDFVNFATKNDFVNFATKNDFVNFATKNDLTTLRGQIKADQDEARAEFHQEMTKPAIQEVETNLKAEIVKVDNKVDKIAFEVEGIKGDITGLNAEFSVHRHNQSLKN